MVSGDRMAAQGVRGAFYNTLAELRKHFERVDIICPRAGSDNVQPFENVFIHPSPWPIWLQPWWIRKKGLELSQANAWSIMTVHEYPPFYNGLGAYLLWRKIKIPYVLEIHHIPGYPRAASIKEAWYCRLSHVFLAADAHRASAVRVVNQHEAPKFLISAGIKNKKIKYFPSLYIDTGIFRPEQTEKKYDCAFVGRLATNKGIDLFVKAVQKAGVSAVIVGDGPLAGAVKRLVYSQGLADRIALHGWAKDSSEVARLLNESKILVIPSFNEGGPRVAMEAMACGIPVISTPVGIVPDVVQNGATGEIVGWDADEIALRIRKILSDPAIQDTYAKAGLDIASKFERSAMIRNYSDFLKTLAR